MEPADDVAQTSANSNQPVEAAYGTTPNKLASEAVSLSEPRRLQTPASLKDCDLKQSNSEGKQTDVTEQANVASLEGDHDVVMKTDSKSPVVTAVTQDSTPVRPSNFANLNPQICGNSFCPTVMQCIRLA